MEVMGPLKLSRATPVLNICLEITKDWFSLAEAFRYVWQDG